MRPGAETSHLSRRQRDYYWKLVARNGRALATGGEGYENRQDAVDMATRLHPDVAVVDDD